LKIAEELGMSEKTLYAWLRQYRKEHNLESISSKPSSSKENRRLRKELARVTKEREILRVFNAISEH
jgi:transposase